MNIVFMGTPDFAVPSLQRIVADGHRVCAVYTQPDKPQGRKFILTPPPVKVTAEVFGIPVFQPKTLKTEEEQARLREFAPDVIVVVAYAKLLPKAVLDIPRLGCINVHGSLLPKYRGAAPIQWSVINGDATAGVTTMYMAESLDSGDMIEKAEISVGPDETAGELFDRLMVLGAGLLSSTLTAVENGTAKRERQDDAQMTLAPKITKETGRLDFTKPALELHNLVRGLNPWPCATAEYAGKKLKILKTAVTDGSGEPGVLLSDKRAIVACSEDALELLELVPEGKGRMTGMQFMQGLRDRASKF